MAVVEKVCYGAQCAMAVLALVCLAQSGEVEECAAIAEHYGLSTEQVEVRLHDGTRADFLAGGFAVEADWSEKWAEGIGQSLFYAAASGRKPGLLLIRRRETPERLHRAYLLRARAVARGRDIWVWESVEGDPTVMLYYPEDPFR